MKHVSVLETLIHRWICQMTVKVTTPRKRLHMYVPKLNPPLDDGWMVSSNTNTVDCTCAVYCTM